jgi:hypothetical protein
MNTEPPIRSHRLWRDVGITLGVVAVSPGILFGDFIAAEWHARDATARDYRPCGEDSRQRYTRADQRQLQLSSATANICSESASLGGFRM